MRLIERTNPATPSIARLLRSSSGWLASAVVLLVSASTAIGASALQRQSVWIDGSGPNVAGSSGLAKSQSLAHVLAMQDEGRLRALAPQTMRPDMAVVVQRHVQQHDGREIFGTGVAMLLDRSSRAIAVSSTLADANDGSRWIPGLDASEAVTVAIVQLTGADPDALAVADSERRLDAVLYEVRSADSRFQPAAPVRVREQWYAQAAGLIPAYRIELIGRTPGAWRPFARMVLVSAVDGRLLRSDDLIRDARPLPRPGGACSGDGCAGAGHAYRVLADRLGGPYVDPYGHTSPHPTAQADGYVPQEPVATRMLRLRHAGISTGDPWLADDATETLGNNVDAFFRGMPVIDGRYTTSPFDGWINEFNPAVGDFRAKVTAPRRFDYDYDVELAPDDYAQRLGAAAAPIPTGSSQLNAKIVQSFYAGNWLHDVFYDLGFDEAAGNMQHDNFGRGGIGGDRLIVHSGHAIGSAFAFAPGDDGVSPVLSLGINNFSLSRRDVAGFDFGVFVHEWTHTMFARLTQMSHQGQPAALNEGTADFVAMFLMVQAGHRDAAPGTAAFHGAYPVGAYWNLDYWFPLSGRPPAGSPGHPDNTYYHGVRRFPYSASFNINPLTFRHISPEHDLPAGFEPFDWKGRGHIHYEIHTAGEIWTSALWQCARNILADVPVRRFQVRQRQFLADLVAALQLFPTDATYTEARDAMLMAVRARDEQDYLRCRAGFAERGLGAGAIAPPRDSIELRGVVESFVDDDPPALRGSS